MLRSLFAEKTTKPWTYEYPLVDGEVSNKAIAIFQAGIMNLKNASPLNGCVDFKGRGYSILGHDYTNVDEIEEEQIARDMDALVKSCRGYDNLPDVKDAKKKLADWLKSRGGQDHNIFIQTMVQCNHFLEDKYRGKSATGQNLLIADWSVNDEGKLELNYSTDINTIEITQPDYNGQERIMISDGRNKIELYPFDMDGQIAIAEKRKIGLAPLMNISTKIQLEIKNGQVIPVVKKLTVTGYNSQIKMNKARLARKNDPRTARVAEILRYLHNKISDFGLNEELRNQLITLMRIIENSNHGENLNAIKLACKYIERIRFTTLKENTTHADYISNILADNESFRKNSQAMFGENLLVTVDHSHDLEVDQLLSPGVIDRGPYRKYEILDIFGVLYLKLHLVLPISTCNYKPGESGHVEAVFVETWRTALLNPAADKKELESFKHGYCINDTHFCATTNNEVIERAIDELGRCAKAESREDTQALIRWLSSRGGHINSFFLQTLFHEQHFAVNLPENIREAYPNLRVYPPENLAPIEAEWKMENDGTLSLAYVFNIPYVRCYADESHQGKPRILDLIATKKTQTTELEFHANHNQTIDPKSPTVLRVEAKIILRVAGGKVTPEMKFVTLDSYSKDITPKQPAYKHRPTPKHK